MAAPPAVLPSIFSLCDLAALDDDPSWGGALEGTLTGSVSYLGLDTMFAADLDPLSGFVAESEPLSDQPLPPQPAGYSGSDPLITATSPQAAIHEKRHAEGGDGRGTPLQSAASTPASSSATIARGPLPAGVKEESSDPPSVDGDGAEAVVTSAFPAHIRASTVSAVRNSNGDMFTRTIGVKDSAAAPLAPEIMPVPPPRAAALAASATVARMAAAETAEGEGVGSAGARASSGTSGAATSGGTSTYLGALPLLSGESKLTAASGKAPLKRPAPGQAAAKKVTGKRPAPPSGCASVAGSEAEGGPGPKPRKRMASRFDSQIDPNLSAEERRRARRMLSNRESARRSRHRKETYLQDVGDKLSEMETLKAAAARAAAEAAERLASLRRDYDAVVAERDMLRTEVAALRSQTCILAVQ